MATKAAQADMPLSDSERLSNLETAVAEIASLLKRAQSPKLNVALDPKERVLGLKRAYDKAVPGGDAATSRRSLYPGHYKERDLVRLVVRPDDPRSKARAFMSKYGLEESPIGVIELTLPKRRDGTSKYNVNFPEIKERDGVTEDELEPYES